MEILSILDVIDLGQEFLLDAVRGVEEVESLTHSNLEEVVGLLDLCDVEVLQLYGVERDGVSSRLGRCKL